MKDQQIVSDLLANNPDFIDLIAKYVDQLPVRVNEIRDAADNQSWKTMRELVHDLNGVSGNYGFPSISQLAASLESQLRCEDYNNICRDIDQLEQLQSRVVVSN